MKTISVLLVSLLLATTSVQARDQQKRRYVGAAIGAVTGAIIAHNTKGVAPWVAVPAGALLGAAMGNNWHQDTYYYSGMHGYDHSSAYRPYRTWGYSPYDYSYYSYYPSYRQVRNPQPARTVTPSKPEIQAKPADAHPGVQLIKIPITHSNGVSTDVSILKVGERFVGPQGEEYESLPTTAQLLEKYGM